MTTPNTPVNGGQILTDRDLLVKRAHEAGFGVIGNFVMPPNHAGHMTEELEHFAATIEAELRASLAAPAIPTVDRNAPDGCKLVPVKPTDAMCIAAREKFSIGANYAEHVYGAMLAAAPAVAQPAAQVAVPDLNKLTRYRSSDMSGMLATPIGNYFLISDVIELLRATPATVKTAEGM